MAGLPKTTPGETPERPNRQLKNQKIPTNTVLYYQKRNLTLSKLFKMKCKINKIKAFSLHEPVIFDFV